MSLSRPISIFASFFGKPQISRPPSNRWFSRRRDIRDVRERLAFVLAQLTQIIFSPLLKDSHPSFRPDVGVTRFNLKSSKLNHQRLEQNHAEIYLMRAPDQELSACRHKVFDSRNSSSASSDFSSCALIVSTAVASSPPASKLSAICRRIVLKFSSFDSAISRLAWLAVNADHSASASPRT
jgi:hypothetical protein